MNGGDGSESATDGGKLEAYLGALGVGVATHACIEAVQGSDFATTRSPNPVSLGQAKALVEHLQV